MNDTKWIDPFGAGCVTGLLATSLLFFLIAWGHWWSRAPKRASYEVFRELHDALWWKLMVIRSITIAQYMAEMEGRIRAFLTLEGRLPPGQSDLTDVSTGRPYWLPDPPQPKEEMSATDNPSTEKRGVA